VLLLVLILVLIAFGLLVVALLTGSVLWAWVSVGVSVAAAAVLLVDWLQRRSAVKAGTEAGDAVPTPAASPVPPPHELVREPVTEVIPVVRPDDPYQGHEGSDAAVAGRDDERPDNRETVVMRPFAPSGSAGGPSGAIDGIGASGPNSSQSVTVGGVEPGGVEHPGGAGNAREGDVRDAVSPDGDPDSETVDLGKMIVKTFPPALDASPIWSAQVMIKHPNSNGMQLDINTANVIPARYVDQMIVKRGGELVFDMDGTFSISTNPNFRFTFGRGADNNLDVAITDTDGAKFAAQSEPSGS